MPASGMRWPKALTVDVADSYTTSAWIATNGAGGVLGLRDRDTGEVLASQTLPVDTSYQQYSLDPVPLCRRADASRCS